MGYIGYLLDVLHCVTVTLNCNCDTLVSQGVTDMIAVNGSCTHFVRQVSVTPYTHHTTPIVIDSIAVADAPCEWALRTFNKNWALLPCNTACLSESRSDFAPLIKNHRYCPHMTKICYGIKIPIVLKLIVFGCVILAIHHQSTRRKMETCDQLPVEFLIGSKLRSVGPFED